MFFYPIEEHIKQVSQKRRRVSKTKEYLSVVLKATAVRLILICHNAVAVWQVVVLWDSWKFWILAMGNFFILGEGVYIVMERDGIEQRWYSLWMVIYLVITMPVMWLLELGKFQLYDGSNTAPNVTNSTALPGSSTKTITAVTYDSVFFGVVNVNSENWIVITQEIMIYLLFLGRWILPRGGVSRVALAEILMEYLAMGTDIMEFFSIFEIPEVRTDSNLTYAVLTIWTLSFLQFIPVVLYRRNSKKLTIPRCVKLNEKCGDHLADFLVTLMTFFLQDGPFLVIRLYVIARFSVVTYSLAFFVVKNILVILVLCYRTLILCSVVSGDIDVENNRPESLGQNPPASPVERLSTLFAMKSSDETLQENTKVEPSHM
ncbi:hypothetical protein ScPMuIL_004364 [Solemya velum]